MAMPPDEDGDELTDQEFYALLVIEANEAEPEPDTM
jgi:hypothetical protein